MKLRDNFINDGGDVSTWAALLINFLTIAEQKIEMMSKQKRKSTLTSKRNDTFPVMSKEEFLFCKENFKIKIKKSLKKSDFTTLTETEREVMVEEIATLFAKAIGKADTRAITKLMNMAYGKPK